ncbi:MAG: pseudouridine synthase [Endozoicomonas sp.]
MIRLARFIALTGYCSRRAACRLIEAGAVLVNGRPGKHVDRVTETDSILVEGQSLEAASEQIYLIYNKPVGIDCVCDENDPDSIVHQVEAKRRVFPVGRLDKDSHGLMLLTSDGELCQRILHPDYFHEKTYRVQVNHKINDEFCMNMALGVAYGDVVTKPCQIEPLADDLFQVTLTQGLNRQIRNMCRALGYRVVDLQRIRMVNLSLGTLPDNQYRELTGQEVRDLTQALGMHSNPEC